MTSNKRLHCVVVNQFLTGFLFCYSNKASFVIFLLHASCISLSAMASLIISVYLYCCFISTGFLSVGRAAEEVMIWSLCPCNFYARAVCVLGTLSLRIGDSYELLSHGIFPLNSVHLIPCSLQQLNLFFLTLSFLKALRLYCLVTLNQLAFLLCCFSVFQHC